MKASLTYLNSISGNHNKIKSLKTNNLPYELKLQYSCMWIDTLMTEDGDEEHVIVMKHHFEEFKKRGKPILIKAVKRRNPTTLRDMCLNDLR